ncbi:MAG: TSUP family transporter [Pseudonocardiaceae bacterium]|nr:TSUP family transporter [Pseudonocardiaceae bacterium]
MAADCEGVGAERGQHCGGGGRGPQRAALPGRGRADLGDRGRLQPCQWAAVPGQGLRGSRDLPLARLAVPVARRRGPPRPGHLPATGAGGAGVGWLDRGPSADRSAGQLTGPAALPTEVPDLLLGAPAIVGLAGAAVVVAAGFVQGLTGLGFAVVFTPLFVLIVPQPHEVILLSLLLGAILSVGVLFESRRAVQVGRTWPLLIGGLVGTPAGIAVLAVMETTTLMIFIAVIALAIAAVGLVRLPRPVQRERVAVGVAGVLGGFLNGSTSMGGSPPALLLSVQRWPVLHSRAALVAFNLGSYLLALGAGAVWGVADIGVVVSGLWLLPLGVLGSVVGACSARGVSQAMFGKVLVCIVGVSGVVGLVSGLRG